MYNTIAMSFKGIEKPEEVFGEIEHELRKTIIENGGSISHHHGVGKLRKDFIPDMISEGSMQLVKDIKNHKTRQISSEYLTMFLVINFKRQKQLSVNPKIKCL